MARNKVFALIAVLLLVASLTMFFTMQNQELKVNEDTAAAVLKQGSTGSLVRTVQTRLKNWGYYTGSVDGIYGPITTQAVRYFQSRNNLVVDGIIGSKTAAALGVNLSSSGTSGYSSSDENLLARCIYGEARGEPYTGQVAIAAVVLNRVKSSKFPNTIAGVIYQPGAFTVVQDGQINLTPNDTARSAARDALNGWDPTNGCIYYYNPATATSAWIWSREVRLVIGSHHFAV